MKPVASAGLFVLIVSSLYAVIGVTFFDSELSEWFGTFLGAQLTLLQITSMDGWIDTIGRQMLDVKPDDVVWKVCVCMCVCVL